ncbi:SDR family NAD(P)-dependent oxidoreductase [Hymenobacter sp. BT770]|uniref:SDR family NAD(P)-dependent oxidoreductase n=1 Tax=Hymenobacter sp. BT770 TaxID=2886942 RepID=UPI001D11DB56|nr:SDR family NAD(P)-dependent oxidoreductase [Hymenobacter sp. BT770]MCC3153086.1 SDR family NAD(P)-dependent oxidoreductase [Hymenobacter sp. BT770]MDO3415440.1 SDR family NAD(P)-dependent oxidoreductase [Hymenobacter sp. BT770]
MNDQTALITGASSGIGFELARCFARDDFRVVLVARHLDELKEAARLLHQEFEGVDIVLLPFDLSLPDSPTKLYAETTARGLQIDALVNDAGFGETGYFSDTDMATELSMIQVNVAALVHLTKLYLRDMLARNAGRILQLGAISSFTPSPCQAVYAATKAFVLSFTEAVQHELKQQKTAVTMTLLCPPNTDTNFFHVAHADNTRAARHTVSARAVAEEGYDVLMEGGARSLPTMAAKVNFFSSLVLPDSMLATIMNNQLHPAQR